MTQRGSGSLSKAAGGDMGRSTFFPTFNVNVPMPFGTPAPAPAAASAQADGAGEASAPRAPSRPALTET